MIRNAEDRKDAAQDIYLKAYKKLPAFKFESKLSTWIARIAFNTCIDDLRKKKLVLQHDIVEENVTEPQPYNPTEQKELAEILKAETEKLPAVSRTLLTLFHNADLSYEEIGEITGMPSGTVKSYLFRARRALKNNLLAEYKKEDL
jgi:RNA polymerase sigma-70 factor (ECF subfamily)